MRNLSCGGLFTKLIRGERAVRRAHQFVVPDRSHQGHFSFRGITTKLTGGAIRAATIIHFVAVRSNDLLCRFANLSIDDKSATLAGQYIVAFHSSQATFRSRAV